MPPTPPATLLLLTLTAAACTPPRDSAESRPSGDDSGDSSPGDTGEPEVINPYLDGADWYQARAVTPGEGQVWELDETFSMPGYTVPSVLVLHEGVGYRMFFTDMADRGSIYMARSDDGLDWAVDPAPLVTPEDFGGACGHELRDVTQIYLPDGSYRMLVEGYSESPSPSTICSIWSADGDTWAIEDGVRFAGTAADEGITSVLNALWYRPTQTWLLFYVAAWEAVDGNAVRIATSTDGETFVPLDDGNAFLEDRVDPDVVRVEGGAGLRMYHSILREGRLGLAEGNDPRTFTDLGALPNLDDQRCVQSEEPQPGDLCVYDPSYLRLPDGTMVLYFSAWASGHDGLTLPYIWRAIATDSPTH